MRYGEIVTHTILADQIRKLGGFPLNPIVPSLFVPVVDGMNGPSIEDLTFGELERRIVNEGLARPHAKALWRRLYRAGLQPELPPPVRRWLGAFEGLPDSEVVADTPSLDGLTRKFLTRLADGQTIETVLMGYDGRFTACVSTQAGCAMGCVFCATGQMGFVRHLRPGEIVAQVLLARRALEHSHPGRRLRNLVLMGMGEPLHNFDHVMTALEIISDVRGIGIGPSKIAISTVGVVPGILRMAEENSPYRLAVSLHGSTEAERAALVPASKRWSLAELIAACRSYGEKTGKRIFFEWTLIEGKNDSPETAQRLAELLRGMDAHVNLIPLNATAGFDGTASSSGHHFQRMLREAGFPCTFRQRRGIDVAAGCGMLKAAKALRGATIASMVVQHDGKALEQREIPSNVTRSSHCSP